MMTYYLFLFRQLCRYCLLELPVKADPKGKKHILYLYYTTEQVLCLKQQ